MCLESLIDAIYDGGSIMRYGNYTLSKTAAIHCAELFVKGRKSIFADVDTAIWSTWDVKKYSPYDFGQILTTEEHDRLIALYKDDEIRSIVSYPDDYISTITDMHNDYLHSISYEGRRQAANAVINNKHIRKEVIAKGGGKCCSCGTTEKLSIDHIVSVANGGGNELDNLQPLCVSCNSKKGSR